MELYLFRHGPAAERDPRRWPKDDARPLTASGVRETRKAARGLARFAPRLERIYTSPARRARRTAELWEEALDGRADLRELDRLLPGAAAPELLDHLGRTHAGPARLGLVGHEPTLGELIGLALSGEAVSVVRLTKAGAAALSFPSRAVPGGARLEWLLTRKQLVALGD